MVPAIALPIPFNAVPGYPQQGRDRYLRKSATRPVQLHNYAAHL